MKKLTLDNVNLKTYPAGNLSNCDFCEEDCKAGLAGSFIHKYKFINYDKKESDGTYQAFICFDCIKQLNNLIKP